MELDYIREHWKLKPGNEEAETAAWDSTAAEYLFEEKHNFEEDPFLRFMAEKTVLTRSMRTLDVGCGAGAYSVAVAGRVGQADGVDLSPRMVALGNAFAREHGVENMRLWVCNWHTCDAEEFRARYDVVFAHTTPAVADYTTLVKMCEASRGSCFFCRPSRRTDLVFDELRRIAGLKEMKRSDEGVAYAFDTLWGLGFDPEVSYEKTVWLPRKTLAEAEAWYLGRLQGSCSLSPETERKLREALASMAVDGVVNERIETTLVNMYWRVDG